MVPRFFVDSKEGFRIEQVRESVLPIVTDDAHRSRIRQAQGRYVLATAAEALSVLLDYISTRSNNLNRLRAEAQQRADGTATAVEELLESLENSFASVRQRLQESRQDIPTGSFAVDTIVTAQAINESQSSTIRKAFLGYAKGPEVAGQTEDAAAPARPRRASKGERRFEAMGDGRRIPAVGRQ